MAHARNQDGFALIEVIVSAAVLAIVALAVLVRHRRRDASSARERARAVAASLAEQDQERLRSYRFDALTKLVAAGSIAVNVDGVELHVKSEANWVTDDGTPTPACGTAGARAERVPADRLDRHVGRSSASGSPRSRSSRSSRRRSPTPGPRHARRQGRSTARGVTGVPASPSPRPAPRPAARSRAARPTARAARSSLGRQRHVHGHTQQAGLPRHAPAAQLVTTTTTVNPNS